PSTNQGQHVFCSINADLQCLPSQMEHEDFVMEGHGKTPPPGEENKQEKEQEKEEQLMEDKKRKKEDKKKKESTQKVSQVLPEATKPSLSQPVTASPIGSSPSPPVNGGNNAKRVAVPNGQPPSAARYMPREVPPRFRCQQDHKVLLKRGQPPPPSCMLLGSGVGLSASSAPGANPNNAQPVPGVLLPCDSGSATGMKAFHLNFDFNLVHVYTEVSILGLNLNSWLFEKREDNASILSTGEKKTGSVGSWGTVRGTSGMDSASCQSNSGNHGNNGKDREDSWKGASVQKSNGSRNDSWDNSNRSTGDGSWTIGPQHSSESKWSEGNKMTSGVSQGEWKQPSGSDELKIGEWSGPNQPNSSTGAWDNQKGHPLPENQGNSQAPCWGRSSSSTGSEVGGQSTGSNHKAGSSDSHNSGRRSYRPTHPDCQAVLQTLLSRTDLDPRVLSNTGWGQTQIKQDTVWDIEEMPRAEGKTDKGTEGWESSTIQTKSSGGWGDAPSQSNQIKSGWGELSTPTEWKEPKNTGGWNDYKNSSTNWGGGRPDEKVTTSWNENSNKDPGWNGRPPNQGWSSGKNGWGEDVEQTKNNNWESSASKPMSSWGEAGQNEIGTWGNSANANCSSKGGWDNNNKRTPTWNDTGRQPNSWNNQQQPHHQQSETPGSWGPPPQPPGNGRPPNPNWNSGPQPNASKDDEPSGWEEPSPQSVSRKMDIDDGTSAWGDPSSYNYKNVNLWDKNSQGGQAPREQNLPTPRPSKVATSVWNKSTPPAPDNGTAAWGEPNETTTGWGEVDDAGASTSWGNGSSSASNAIKSSSKPTQDGWGDNDGPVSTRHSSWEEEEEGGVWNTAGSQGSSSSHNSTSWGQGGKKPQIKCSLKGGSNDSWMNTLSDQISNMGLLVRIFRKHLCYSSGLQDKKFDVDKRGMNLGDFNDIMRKGRSGFRPPNSKDMGTPDSGPYFEKGGNQGLFGNSTAQSRGMHPPVQPLNPSPNIRAQVPPQFLSPQVSAASMLKQFPNSSLNPGLFNMGPQLSPQQIAMLSQLPQIPQFQLACQLLLQQQQQQQQQQLLQNQRKISQAVRQQQEQQLARMVSAFQQQQRQPGMKHSPSHPVGPKPHIDAIVSGGLNVGLSDISTKGQIPGYGSGFGSSGMDYGMVGGKETGSESRFKQWTSMMDGLPPVASQDANMHKNGTIVPPGKARGGSPYNQFDIIPGDPLGSHTGPAGDGWLPAKSPPTSKIGSKSSNASWPPEFQPGVPWKGIPNIDPESDPYVTPGSVLGGTATSPIVDTDHQLLRDNTTGSNSSLNTSLPSPGAWPYSASDNSFANVHSTSAKFNDYKSTWSPDPIGPNPAHLSNKMWKNHISSRNTTGLPRPPPGLSNPKSSSPWSSTAPRSLRAWGAQESRLASASTWSDGGSVRASYWLVLHNLTPQIDGSTLRTICMQHGPLLTFHLNLTQGTALIRYSTKQEAAKAQTALHMCVLGNTTILAEFATDEEVSRFLAQAQPPPAATPSTPAAGWQSLETGQNQTDPVGPALNLFGGSTGLGQWSSGGGGNSGGDLAGASLWGPPNYSSSLWGVQSVEDPHRMGSPAPLLPGDLLGGGSDSI
uniref:Trinucleotide repeat containing adaptor 6B n=1 Tax=Anolis carolinensis TaxID=28377 RepID=A0A803T458_ANOCA